MDIDTAIVKTHYCTFMDSVFKLPASPGTPLFPVSPERANRQQLPISPSRQSDFSPLHNETLKGYHSRNSSDVQGKVAQFNNLSKEASQKRKDNEAALKRAMVGREEAESETRRLREENGLLRQEVEDAGVRENKVGARMEALKVWPEPTVNWLMALTLCRRRCRD